MTGRRRAALLGAAAGLAVVVAACTGGAPPPSATAIPLGAPVAGREVASEASDPAGASMTSGTPSAPPETAAPASSVAPTLPDEPPSGQLHGLAGGREAHGELGSYTWADSGTDAPWVVGPATGTATEGSSLTVAFENLQPVSWTAAWAAVSGGMAAAPSDGSAGQGAVALRAPSTAGDWSLRVSATFGPGANATYYWHLAVAP